MKPLAVALVGLAVLATLLTLLLGPAFSNGLSETLLALFALYVGLQLLRADRKERMVAAMGSRDDAGDLRASLLQEAAEHRALGALQSPTLLYGAWFGGVLKIVAIVATSPIPSWARLWATGPA